MHPARLSASPPQQSHTTRNVLLATALALVASALVVRRQVQRVERAHPPHGRFIEVDGVRLHVIDRGPQDGQSDEVLVLLHGNGTMALDFELAGLVDAAARTRRVIAFDRPGFGYSERPRDARWTPEAQAQLLLRALHMLGVQRAAVLGHSWGTLVAIAMGLKDPTLVQRLVLVSGYYYPTLRLDAVLLSPPALPLVGDLLRHTLAPLQARLLWPLVMRKMFGPRAVPPSFERFPKWMAMRPRQLRAAAGESAGMMTGAARLSKHYRELAMPVAILAGSDDRIAYPSVHAQRLHADLPHSTLTLVPGQGHMLQHLAPGIVRQAALGEAASAPVGEPTPMQERWPFSSAQAVAA
jgi:pimeloyl-ACP methyl ester carboxylesterase